ncbi:TPA: hypothetical protein I9281_003923 [Serratia marcescens]|nr:hypothetical protein [Serratia marcescens]
MEQAVNIHIISDDNFFSLGCETILKIYGHEPKSVTSKDIRCPYWHEKVKNGDIVFVAISSHYQVFKVLKRISDLDIRVMLFIDFPNQEYASSMKMNWLNVFFSKRIEVSLLMVYVEAPTLLTGASIPLLSEREREVMEMLANGSSFKKVSDFMGISLKTVYSHRRNSLNKIGLNHAKSFFLIGYQDYFYRKEGGMRLI